MRGDIIPITIMRIGKNRPHWCFRRRPNATAEAMMWTNNDEIKENIKHCSHISTKNKATVIAYHNRIEELLELLQKLHVHQ